MFTDVKVPKENRIGEEGFGFKFAMETLNGGRIGIAAQALGIAAGALELSVKYALERKPLAKRSVSIKPYSSNWQIWILKLKPLVCFVTRQP